MPKEETKVGHAGQERSGSEPLYQLQQTKALVKSAFLRQLWDLPNYVTNTQYYRLNLHILPKLIY